jgi:dTDP-4-dehydrorhamnose 3,5-epimerase
MRFEPTAIPEVVIVDLEEHGDERGFFARAWCEREFEDAGLNPRLVQVNLSYNRARNTLRGMHYQRAPHAEAKLVRCIRGAIFDVAVDIRADSPTFGRWVGAELSAANRRMLYVPEGFGHGFQTLADDTEVLYQVSEFYAPEAEAGFPWDDTLFAVDWPLGAPEVISDKDAAWPDFLAAHATARAATGGAS